ncbi:MAG: RING finger protein [Pirellulaceae bacterium]
MDCFVVFLAMLFACAVAIGVWKKRSRYRRSRRLLRQLAQQFAGVYESGGLLSPPHVQLRYGETTATVCSCRPRGSFRSRGIEVRVAWPHVHLRCEILAKTRRLVTTDLQYSWPRVPLADPAFTDKFLVSGFTERDVLQLLTSGVRWNLDCLRSLGPDRRLYVLIREGHIVVRKFWKRIPPDQAAQLVQGALELYDQCMLAKAAGIEFLNTDILQPLDQVVCKICGDTIEHEMVYCRRCKTPHHEECWNYTGVCSVFGCRETVYHRPLPSRADPPGRINKPR